MTKQRILIYSQSLVGLGHVVRGAALANALSDCYEVRLIGGWMPDLGSSLERDYCCVPLIPLRLDLSQQVNHPLDFEENYSCLLTLQPDISARDAIEARKQRILQEIADFEPDVFITEYYPFGRWVFGLELVPAINYARRQGARILCSVRDVLKPPDPKSRWRRLLGSEYEAGFKRYYRRAIGLLNQEYDALLVHSDRRVIEFEASVNGAEMISIPIFYTGFLSTSLHVRTNSEEYQVTNEGGTPYIVISAGGGYGEYEFLQSWLPVLNQVRERHLGPQCEIVVLAGPLMEEGSYLQLKDACSLYARTKLSRYCNRFQDLLDNSVFSVSRAGYNTAFNILCSHAPALLVPATHLRDQALRACRFEALGIAGYCDPEADFSERVDSVMSVLIGSQRTRSFDTQGAIHTLEAIQYILMKKP
jgi:predicted glycosyltransferase